MFKNSRTAFKIYQKLTDDERNILESRKIDGKYSIKEWYRMLKHLALMDRFADKARNNFKLSLIGLGLATFFTLIFSFNKAPFYIALPITLIPGGALGLLVFYYQTLKDIDLGNHMRLFIMPSLNLMSQKVPGRGKVEMNMDLHPFNHEDYKVDEEVFDDPHETHLKKKTHVFFHLPWLTAKIPLKDGALLVMTVEDKVREKKVVKYRKNKRKTKYKSKHILRMKLALPKKRYQLLNARKEQFNITEDEKFIIISGKEKQVTEYNPLMHNEEKKSLDPRLLAKLLADAYKCVEPISPQQQSA